MRGPAFRLMLFAGLGAVLASCGGDSEPPTLLAARTDVVLAADERSIEEIDVALDNGVTVSWFFDVDPGSGDGVEIDDARLTADIDIDGQRSDIFGSTFSGGLSAVPLDVFPDDSGFEVRFRLGDVTSHQMLGDPEFLRETLVESGLPEDEIDAQLAELIVDRAPLAELDYELTLRGTVEVNGSELDLADAEPPSITFKVLDTR